MAVLTLHLLCALAAPAAAALKVFACEPEWGALAQELGENDVSVYTATSARQDPHRIEARPSLIAQVRKADLLVCTGADLEIGWLPALLRQSGNARVQPGQPGYFAAADVVRKLEVPAVLDRAMGDVHPFGNPHIHTNPHNLERIADTLAKRLVELDPAHATRYRARHQAFASRWEAALRRWEEQAAPLRGMPIIAQHNSWVYLNDWLGLRQVATLEPKPGIPPSGAHLAAVLTRIQQQPVKMVIRSAYEDPRPSRWLAERANIPAVELPYTVGGSDRARDLLGLFDDTVQRLLGAAP
jgi:zinc/manganese transport system substrate-binding protein